MEHTPGQQNPMPAPPPSSPQAPPPAPHIGRGTMVQRGSRLLVRRVLYGTTRLGRALRPYLAFLAIIVVLLALTSWLTLRAVWPTGQAAADPRVSALTPSAAVENYLRGQHDFNAELMWSSYSASYQTQQLQRGASKQTLQTLFSQMQSEGLHFTEHEYVGGVPISGGGRMYFYAVQVDAGTRHGKIPMTFLVNPDDQVEQVISPFLPDATSGSSTNTSN